VIEWDRVAELRDEVGEDDFTEVVELFLEEVEGVLARLMAQPAPETLESELHFIKGSALNLGFAELALLCLEGERRARAGDTAAIDVGLVDETYRISKSLFLDGLHDGAPALLVG
jgi:histidine phosphotransfer protein HptB